MDGLNESIEAMAAKLRQAAMQDREAFLAANRAAPTRRIRLVGGPHDGANDVASGDVSRVYSRSDAGQLWEADYKATGRLDADGAEVFRHVGTSYAELETDGKRA